MSNDYVTSILVDQRLSEFRYEAAQDRLARVARAGQPRRRWWERLMLFRSPAAPSRSRARVAAATAAAGNSLR